MMSALVLIVTALFLAAPQEAARVEGLEQVVQCGRLGAVAQFTGVAPVPLALTEGVSVNNPEQQLTTTVGVPQHPLEPWTVTTFRRPGESTEAFIRRHRITVDAVRAALNP